MAAHNNGNLYADLVPADERVEAVSGTQELAGGCLDGRVVNLRSQVLEQLNTNLLFNSSMAGATGSVLPTNWASGSVSGLTYTISSASTVQGLRSIEWTVNGTALSDGDLWLACEPMVSGSVVAQIPSEYVGSMYCAKVSGTINAGMVLQTLTQNFINGAVQETKTKDLAAVTGQTFVRIEPNSVKTDIDLENRVNLRLYQSIASGEVIDFTIRVAAPQVEAGFAASPFISTVSGAVSEVRGRPSILVVPQLTKAGVVYPQIPVVSGADFTVSRNTTATRVNSSGLIQSVASGVPRIDWLGQSCPALLVEASGQNLALQSENFGTTWSPNQLIAFGSGSVLNTTGTLDPYGTNVSDLIVASTVSGVQHRIDQTTTSASGSYTFSVFVKAAGYNFTWLRIGTVGAFFNLSNGAITGTSAGIVASSQNYGNGWYRCIISKASSSANEVLRINIIQTDGVTDFAGDGTSGIYVFGAQYETGTVATTYIPTTSGTGSRAADVISASGALVSGLIGQTEGTIYAEVDVRNFTQTDRPIIQLFLDSNNRILLEAFFFSPTFGVKGSVITSGSSVANITFAITNSGIYKIALAYKQNDFAFFVNGTLRGTDTLGNLPSSLNAVHLGHNNGSSQLSNYIRAAAIYTTRLSNAQLAELTRL